MQEYQLSLENASIDLALVFSLFTHLNQPDSACYFRELARALKPDAVALLIFFLITKDRRARGNSPTPGEDRFQA
ncbi:MAG: class I SAM-dependent methyltransferase [Anaerolineae bacterium]|nr:class I SAM-dependent methyltransferase [Anaerolineae bacterium]